MRDVIAHALVRVLDLILSTRRTGPGRHSAAHFAARDVRDVAEEVAADPGSVWRRPWPGPSSAQARAVFRAEEARGLDPERRERFFATAWAELGYDYPYAADGVHQVRTGVAA
ncbi:hypothetical protein [Streptomyces uncialis]|uniref:Uncharacterized protein n=1 Tax=Streptomyces uncialis TaxID=1048205 RepID=A0A1Q4V2I6_9ACTN|nr:hypothetical protein [Streptomyces uncialis]OKH91949.1 hypothetical protein AB852_27290 [Streptomyces uncialis]